MTDLFVQDLSGREISLEAIASDKPTLFIFVRHFG